MVPPNIFFYCPSPELINSVPSDVDSYWTWINWVIRRYPTRLPDGRICDWHGPYSWTVQTWMQLQKHGRSCELVDKIPNVGIVLSHSDFWPPNLKPSAEQLFVEIKPDRKKVLGCAHITVVQSSHDPLLKSCLAKQGRVEAINYWPQPSLIGRNSERSSLVRRAVFFGNKESFLSDVPKLKHELDAIGVSFQMPPRLLWNDYSEVDLIIAVRNASAFQEKTSARLRVDMKPPNKLINAWLAGVPSILSPEPSYLQLRRSHADFLCASTIDEIIHCTKHLKNNPSLYSRMVRNAKLRGRDFGSKAVVNQWVDMIEGKLIPAYRTLVTGHEERRG